MTQKRIQGLNGKLTDEVWNKARIRYELSHYKYRLKMYLDSPDYSIRHADKIINLCTILADKYTEYLLLIDKEPVISPVQLSVRPYHLEHFSSILILEQKLTQVITLNTKKELIKQIISLYQQVTSTQVLSYLYKMEHDAIQLKQLLVTHQFEHWLIGVANFWSHHDVTQLELVRWFHDWDIAQQKAVLDFFTQKQWIDLVNMVFFYKLYPEKLFSHAVHPEKLLSVRTRLIVLHNAIELIQHQFHSMVLQNGLVPETDYLLHGNELPQGVKIEVNEGFREIIWIAVKQLKITTVAQHKQQIMITLLHDLGRAYKFWFNPNHLIDTVMSLRQAFFSEHLESDAFQQEMISLFHQLTTTECLDLYGYFANNDTRYLLYTLFAITQDIIFDWLTPLNQEEKKVIERVFTTLCCVMDGLRYELRNRGILTEPYHYRLEKQLPQIGRRNREAVFRAIAMYHHQVLEEEDSLEQLFLLIEEET